MPDDESQLRQSQFIADPELDADINDVFRINRDRLRRMVQFRMDRRLQGRVDASDVLQDAYLEAIERFDRYRAKPSMPIFVWLRFLVAERLTTLHRHHLHVKARDANREVSLGNGSFPAPSTVAIAEELLGSCTSPSNAAVRSERIHRLLDALSAMDPIDRDVLSLRHFEHLSRRETAQVLNITEAASGKRYLRALQKLKGILSDLDSSEG